MKLSGKNASKTTLTPSKRPQFIIQKEQATMCEFKVLKKNKLVFKDAIYAKVEDGNVTVKDILGVAQTFEKCVISEVDVGAERLVLTPVKQATKG